MAYGILNSPLPSLTVSSTGERCCGMRGVDGYQPGAHALLGMLGMLGDDTVIFDTTPTDPGGGLVDPGIIDPGITDGSVNPIIDTGSILNDLPLPNQLSPSLNSMYPQSVGTEFTGNGDGTYTNIQTGQIVPYSIAEQITAATAGAPAVDTTATGQNLTITDPNTGATSTINTNNLSVAAQALQAAGQLVNAAGKLTSQGQALLHQGNLYKASPPSSGIAGAMNSLTSWMNANQNLVLIGGLGLIVLISLPGIISAARSGKKRR